VPLGFGAKGGLLGQDSNKEKEGGEDGEGGEGEGGEGGEWCIPAHLALAMLLPAFQQDEYT
jgi:hypothetical protein